MLFLHNVKVYFYRKIIIYEICMKTRKRRRKNTVTKGLNPKKELNLKKTSKKTSKIKLKKMNCSPKPKGEMNNF